jgi:protein-S-isoprenylcysteine O-methyltransferase Ste14
MTMRHGVYRTITATLAFAAVHSVVASKGAKRAVTTVVGQRRRNAWYRPFFIAQSVATSGSLVWYLSQLPDKPLYTLQDRPARLVSLVRLGLVAYAWAAVRQIGVGNILGLPGLKAWWRGEDVVPAEPEAQGPRPGDDGKMKAGGPFQLSRHPLNSLAVPILWLSPKMTANRMTFNLIASAYLFFGSKHEEKRLSETYGPPYEAYRASGVPYFLPLFHRLIPRRWRRLLKHSRQA